MPLPITLTMAAGAALMHIWLAIRCSVLRARHKISIGDGDHVLLRTRMRAHSNFSENMPLFLILLGLVELGGGTNLWLWGAAIVFILARLAHVFGMERPIPNVLRVGGMLVTMVVLFGLAVYAIDLSYRAPHLG